MRNGKWLRWSRTPALLAIALAVVGSTLSVTAAAAPAAAKPPARCGIDNAQDCSGPQVKWMQSTKPATAPRAVQPTAVVQALACGTVANGDQLVVIPGAYKALVYNVSVQFCFNDARDIVSAIPTAFVQDQLFQSELENGLPSGSLGRISNLSAAGQLPLIRLGDPPINTFNGGIYAAQYTVTFTYTPAGGAAQTYRVSARLAIDFYGAWTFPPTFQLL
jgi:hypothetical protein